MAAVWSTGVTGGRVEVDEGLCIVLVQPRLNKPDERFTVTDVDGLCAALQDARTMQRVAEESCGDCGRAQAVLAERGHAETCRWYRWNEQPA